MFRFSESDRHVEDSPKMASWPADWRCPGKPTTGPLKGARVATASLWMHRCEVDEVQRALEPWTIVAENYKSIGRVLRVTALPSYDDHNSKVETEQGMFVLKIATVGAECRGGCDSVLTRAALECEGLLSEAVSVRAARVVRSDKGETVIAVDGTRFARLSTWVDGVALSSYRSKKTPELSRAYGVALGEVVRSLASFKDDDDIATKRPLAWDLRRAKECTKLLPYITDPKRRALAERALERFPAIPETNVQLIHGDANDENVLVTDDLSFGFVDFGDFLKAPRVLDLAIGLAYALMGTTEKSTVFAELRAIVGGFDSVCPLTPAELACLVPLVMARNVQTVANAAHRAALEPDNTYVTIHAEPAWKILTILDTLDDDEPLLLTNGHHPSTTNGATTTTTTTTSDGEPPAAAKVPQPLPPPLKEAKKKTTEKDDALVKKKTQAPQPPKPKTSAMPLLAAAAAVVGIVAIIVLRGRNK